MTTILDILKAAHTATLRPVVRVTLGDDLTQDNSGVADANHDGFDDATGYLLDAVDGTVWYGTDHASRAKLSGTPVSVTAWTAIQITNSAELSPAPSTATLTLPINPSSLDLLNARCAITIEAGYVCGGVARYELIFAGLIVDAHREHWPPSIQVSCQGRLRAAATGAGRHDWYNIADEDLVGNLLNVADIQSNQRDIDGAGMTLGTSQRQVILERGTPPLSLIGDLNKLGYVVFDSRMGYVLRREMLHPGVGTSLHTYADGVPASGEYPVLPGCALPQEPPFARFNKQVCFGAMPQQPNDVRPHSYRVDTGAIVANGGLLDKHQEHDWSSELWLDADTCDKVARHAMHLENAIPWLLTLRTAFNPYAEPNQALKARFSHGGTVKGLETNTDVVCTALTHSFTQQGQATTTRTCRINVGDLGSQVDLTPVADLAGSTNIASPGRDVNGDATGSTDPIYGLSQLSFLWTHNRGAERGTGQTIVLEKVPTALATGLVLRVRVTNPNGLWDEDTYAAVP